MINSKYLSALEAGAQMAWIQQDLHLQNIANIETPGYKSKSLVFDDTLKELASGGIENLPDQIEAQIVTDESSILPDGNNVDLDKESIEMYKAYAQYNMILGQIKSEFTKINTVLNSNFK